MQLFLLFSLALTFVAFLSIVLAEQPQPLATESELQFGLVLPNSTAQNEPGIGIPGSALDNEQVPTAATVAVEELRVMF